MLGDSKKMLSESQRVARIGSWSWDLEGPIIWTDQTYRVYGVSPETFTPSVESLVNLVHPEDRPAMQEWIRACSAGENPDELEFRCVWPDGTIHWISGRGELIHDAVSRTTHMSGTAQDITERKRAEAVLRESEAKFRLLAESIEDVFWISTPTIDRMVYVSPAYETVWGRTCESLYRRPKSFAEAIHPEDQGRVIARISEHASENWDIEYRILRPDGSMRWIHGRGYPIRDERGKLISRCGVAKDITERKRAEEALKNSNVLLNEMGRIAAIGGWEFPLVTPNQAGTELKQVWTDEVYRIHEVDRNYSPTVSKGIEFYAPASRPIIERAVQNAITKGEPFDVELELITAKGNQRWVHAIGRVDRERAKVFGIFQDITEPKRAEQALQTALAEKDVLLREIHHRVKNTLQMTSALLELQSGYVKDEQALAYFKDSQQRIQSMAMAYAQLYHSQSLAQIDFAAYLNTLVDNLRGQYAEQCEQVNIRVAAQACILPVNTAIPCGLVITELVSNTMKHAFPKGRAGELRIGLQAVEFGKVVLEVTDDGVGLPPGLDIYNSPSFGLRLIRLMVEDQLDGKLTIESNRGTRVVCEIGEQK